MQGAEQPVPYRGIKPEIVLHIFMMIMVEGRGAQVSYYREVAHSCRQRFHSQVAGEAKYQVDDEVNNNCVDIKRIQHQ